MKRKKNKQLLLVVSLCIVLGVSLGGTLAFLFANSITVENTFVLGNVTTTVDEKFENNVKTDVRIQNTGNVDAYIRAAVIVTWQDEAGNVSADIPEIEKDYSINWSDINGGKWFQGSDDLYYYKQIVKPNDFTSVLFTDCKIIEETTPPEGYKLNVEIIGSGIQANGKTSEGIPAVEDAWKVVKINNEVLVPVQTN